MDSSSQFIPIIESDLSTSLSSSTDESSSDGDGEMVSQRYHKRVQNMISFLFPSQMVTKFLQPVQRGIVSRDRAEGY